MRRGLGLLFSLGVFGLSAPIYASSQVAPLPYTPVPAPPVDSSQVGAPAASRDQPQAMIRGWSFGDELRPSYQAGGREVQLDPETRDVVFFFETQKPSPSPVEYRYRLDDFDPGWNITRNQTAHYRRLPPGNYRFEVQAHTSGQAWTTRIAELSVVQLHFFFQAWYFYVLLCIGLVALGFELLRQRDQLLKGQIALVLEDRNRIASDCHDTLMAGFAAISWQLEATSQLFGGSDEGTVRAAQSCELARKMVAHCQAEARRIIWDLRDTDEITGILSRALTRALTTNRMRDNVEIVFEVEGEEIPIAPAAVHHFVCIGQEAVNNAVRHSGASLIRVRLVYESDSLELSIRDNGCGFQFIESQIRPGHFGILVMEERSHKLGGVFHLDSEPGKGTEIAIMVDFRAIHPFSEQQQQVVPWIGV